MGHVPGLRYQTAKNMESENTEAVMITHICVDSSGPCGQEQYDQLNLTTHYVSVIEEEL